MHTVGLSPAPVGASRRAPAASPRALRNLAPTSLSSAGTSPESSKHSPRRAPPALGLDSCPSARRWSRGIFVDFGSCSSRNRPSPALIPPAPRRGLRERAFRPHSRQALARGGRRGRLELRRGRCQVGRRPTRAAASSLLFRDRRPHRRRRRTGDSLDEPRLRPRRALDLEDTGPWLWPLSRRQSSSAKSSPPELRGSRRIGRPALASPPSSSSTAAAPKVRARGELDKAVNRGRAARDRRRGARGAGDGVVWAVNVGFAALVAAGREEWAFRRELATSYARGDVRRCRAGAATSPWIRPRRRCHHLGAELFALLLGAGRLPVIACLAGDEHGAIYRRRRRRGGSAIWPALGASARLGGK